MKKIILAFFVCMAVFSCDKGPVVESSMPYKIVNGAITFKTPEREPGQKSALKLACDPIDTVRIGFVGLGNRGSSAIKRYVHIDGARIVALCDLREEKVKASQNVIAEAGLPPADEYIGEDQYKIMCERDDIDLVYICTDWEMHAPIAIYAMEHGKHAASEVPCGVTLEQCWQLVNTCEKTRKHYMMLENCCYDAFEMAALNMAQQNILGEIYHAEGAYIHKIHDHWGSYYNDWRAKFNQSHAGDNYPTHGFGPICQAMNIHRGDKMNTLVSMDTKSIVGLESTRDRLGVEEFAEGDHVVTLIRTENGHQMEIHHNVYSERPYSRMYQLTGSKGFANKYPTAGFCFSREQLPEGIREKECYEGLSNGVLSGPALTDELMNDFKHPVYAEHEEMAMIVGGHGGMDYVMDARLIWCLRNGMPLDMDVYDAAEWSCVRELSEISVRAGSMPVKVPDFTRGDWNVIDGFRHSGK